MGAKTSRTRSRRAAKPAETKATEPTGTTPATSSNTESPRLDRATWWRCLGLCVLSGTLWFLSCADFDIWPFAWIAMVPTIWVVDRKAVSHRQAFFFAWITGVVGNGGGFYWIIGLLTRFGHMPWIVGALIFGLLAAYQGLVFGTFGAVVRAIRLHTRVPTALLAPIVLVGFELVYPMIFPFSVAITQAWVRPVIQIADVTGSPGVAALLLMVNGAFYDVLFERPRPWRVAAVSSAILVGALVYGYVRIGQVERARAAAPSIEVGVVQPNVAFDMKGRNRAQFAAQQLEDLHEQTAQLASEGAQFVVWPETGYPYPLARLRENDYPVNDFRRIRRTNVPLFFGAVTWSERPDGSVRLWNTAFLLDQGDHFRGHFDKIYLMLFGEFTPGRDRFPIIAKLLPNTTGQFIPGDVAHTIPLRLADGQTFRLAPMICYEDIIASFGRALAPEHPHLLVNITNDSWFGDTSEPWEHLALSVYRSVEMRTDLVRAVNTGVSAFVDATGRVFAKTYAVNPKDHPRGADRLRGRVAMLEGGHTVYARIGNVFAYLCAAATAYLWLVKPRIRRVRA